MCACVISLWVIPSDLKDLIPLLTMADPHTKFYLTNKYMALQKAMMLTHAPSHVYLPWKKKGLTPHLAAGPVTSLPPVVRKGTFVKRSVRSIHQCYEIGDIKPFWGTTPSRIYYGYNHILPSDEDVYCVWPDEGSSATQSCAFMYSTFFEAA